MITPKVNIRYVLEDGSEITLNILDAKTRHLEQYVADLSPKKTVTILRELRNSLRDANDEIERLEKNQNDVEVLETQIDDLEEEIIALKERLN